MSVPNQTPYIIYNANGITTVFPFEFYIINAGDITVTINGEPVTSGYTVSGAGNVGGGDIIFLTPPAAGSVVMLERIVPTYRLTDYQDNGDLLADTINKDFDRLWMAIQRSFIYLGLALRRPLLGGPYDAEGFRISRGADPVDKQDFATKNYVDNVALSHVLRVPDSYVAPLPPLAQLEGKLIGVVNGIPVGLLPASGSATEVMAELLNPDGLKYIGACHSITQLRTVQGGYHGQQIFLASWHPGRNIGGGYFRWDSLSSEDDDNGIIIKPVAISGEGRWTRICDSYYVEDFGAYNDAVDNTQAFHDAIKSAGHTVKGDIYADNLKPGIRNVRTRGGRFHILGDAEIIVPSQVEIDLCGAEIVGNTTNTIFVTGGYNVTTGALESNISLPDGTYRVTGTKIHNGIIRNAGLGYNVKNFAEQSEVHSLTFVDCAQCGISDSSWYGAFHTMTSRNPTAPKTHTQPAFVFSTYVNSQNIHHINVTQRKLAYRFDGSVNGQRLEFVNAENCENGITFSGEVMPIYIYGYYEDITDVAINMGAVQAHRSVYIDGFFNNVNVCFYGHTLTSGSFGRNGYYQNCTKIFDTAVGSINGLSVHIPTDLILAGNLPGIPSKWVLAGFEDVRYPNISLDASGNPSARQNFTGGLVDLPFSGDQGDASTYIPFCSQFNSATAKRTIVTGIKFRTHMIVLFNLTIESIRVRGRCYDNGVVYDGSAPSGISITPSSNSSGFLQLEITGSSMPSIPNQIFGVIRMP